MEVQCPKHKINLETEHTTLTVLQQDYSVVIGHCPLCQSMYINKRLWFSDGRVKIEKHTYEYLNDLDVASQKEESKIKAEELQKRRLAQRELREKLIAERDRIQAMQKQRELKDTEPARVQIEIDSKTKTKKEKQKKRRKANLSAIEEASILSRDSQTKKTTNMLRRRGVKSSDLVPRSLAQRWLSTPIQHKSDNVICPYCEVLIPTRDEYVHVKEFGHLQIKVGYCPKCSCFYSSTDKTHEQLASLNGITIFWSNLRYIGGTGNKIRFRKYARHTSSNLTPKIKLQKDTIINNTNLSNNTLKTDSNSIYDKIIKQLPVSSNNCPLCKRANNGMLRVKYHIYDSNHIPQLRFSYARHCPSCDIIFFDHGQEQTIKDQFSAHKVYTINASLYHSAEALMAAATTDPPIVSMKTADTTLPFEVRDYIRPNLSFEKRVILVYAKKCHCEKCFEKYKINPIINRTAVVNTVAGKTVETNVMFCRGCGRYFMNHTTFEQYQKLYGGLLFEYRFTGELVELNKQYLRFAPDSILSRCGYNVRSETSKEERHARLRYILETHKATKWELIELISGFISLRRDNPKFDGACVRWQEDILYINQHKIESQKKVYGLSFKQGK